MNLQEYFADTDARFDSEIGLPGQRFTSPGYHTLVPSGEWVHVTVVGAEYAVLLLRTRESERVARAHCVLERLLEMQDTDPTSATYGIWPYLYEEAISSMAPPDWNMADFVGVRLAEILLESSDLLSPDLCERVRQAVGHAAWCVFRRNSGPGYTNIAIMGAGLTAAAGELLSEPRLLGYSRKRAQDIVAHARRHGGFNEYNSPAYTPIALHECERILHLVQDEAIRAAAEELRLVAWRIMAQHFHPGTNQWAGPHARAYTDRLSSTTLDDLAERLGFSLGKSETKDDGLWIGRIDLTVIPVPCPDGLKRYFKQLSAPLIELRECYIQRAGEGASTEGVTWMVEEACLGSVSRENFFYQRRPVLAYWKTATAPAVLKLRFLHDGRDFCSAYVRSAQHGPRVLSAVSLLTGLGDYALHMDIPPGGVFQAEDFRLRYELLAPNANASTLDNGRFDLSADGWRAVIHTLPLCFGGYSVRWESGSEEGRAWLDAVCYAGPRRGFRMEEIDEMQLSAGLELLQCSDVPLDSAPFWNGGDEHQLRVYWDAAGDLSLKVPRQAEPYLWAAL